VTEACRDEPITHVIAVLSPLLKNAITEHFSGNVPTGFGELVTLLEKVHFVREKDTAVVDPATTALSQRVTTAYGDEPAYRVMFVLGTVLLIMIRQQNAPAAPMSERNRTFLADLVSVIEREILLRQSETGREQ